MGSDFDLRMVLTIVRYTETWEIRFIPRRFSLKDRFFIFNECG
jgi:hypothetical protein